MIDEKELLENLEKEIFSAELYGDEWDGQTVDNLLCLGNVAAVIEEIAVIEEMFPTVRCNQCKFDRYCSLQEIHPDIEFCSLLERKGIKND